MPTSKAVDQLVDQSSVRWTGPRSKSQRATLRLLSGNLEMRHIQVSSQQLVVEQKPAKTQIGKGNVQRGMKVTENGSPATLSFPFCSKDRLSLGSYCPTSPDTLKCSLSYISLHSYFCYLKEYNYQNIKWKILLLLRLILQWV